MEYSNKKSKLFWIIPTVLLIIILILLSFYINFGKIEEPSYIPTGNVDVFDIDISCICDNNSNKDKVKNTGSSITGNCVTTDKNGNKIVIPKYNKKKKKSSTPDEKNIPDEESNPDEKPIPDEDDDYDGEVYVDDIDGNYVYHQNLRIFNNSAFKYKNKIAPGTSNVYNFTVHNSSKMNVKYNIEMEEETSYNLKLKYRLKRNDSYIIGNNTSWVNAEQLITEFNRLNSKTSDKYSLDWKWEYEEGKDVQDTNIGENMDDAYKLSISIYFEQVE